MFPSRKVSSLHSKSVTNCYITGGEKAPSHSLRQHRCSTSMPRENTALPWLISACLSLMERKSPGSIECINELVQIARQKKSYRKSIKEDGEWIGEKQRWSNCFTCTFLSLFYSVQMKEKKKPWRYDCSLFYEWMNQDTGSEMFPRLFMGEWYTCTVMLNGDSLGRLPVSCGRPISCLT